MSPTIWMQIEAAAKHPAVGSEMNITELLKVLKQKNFETFKGLAYSTVWGWIDHSGDKPRWSDRTIARAEAGNFQGRPNGGRRGVLAGHPDVADLITNRVTSLRDAGAPVTLVTVRALFVATILDKAPQIFDKQWKDGSFFRVSDAYLCKWLHDTLRWSIRRPTSAAQKIPDNWEDLCKKSFFRMVHAIKEHYIPPSLIINSDQTGIVYAPGDGLTWAQKGSKQVPVVGKEEKRAFTLVVSVLNNGGFLGFQGVYVGSTPRSRPDPKARGCQELANVGCKFVSSATNTHWSNQQTMRDLVTDIIAPYLKAEKERLHLPPTQKGLWELDLWAVHRSAEFGKWMTENYPDIIITFVPGGTTPKWQPCDVGMNRPLKHAIRRSFHEDMVAEYLQQIDVAKKEKTEIKFDRTMKSLRNNSVGWIWDAWQAINDVDLIKAAINDVDLIKAAFKSCRTKQWDLSYESLTGFEAREALRNIKATDPEFWAELEGGKIRALEKHNEGYSDNSDPASRG
ncbi:DDE superfamily endonuclease [Mycena venus]|uniref:DDE superfamily endonuclease n=1 Tax=Mycena venus TaxID=2733690 RepID=A0A8H6XPG1_9AGAR|nr:DDE superfamily endonuclease [Mycena venus]